MVAYSFQERFVLPIVTGRKRQTIRAVGRRRHARSGEALQLYTGMRTKACRLIARATCEAAQPITLDFGAGLVVSGDGWIRDDGTFDGRQRLEAFARSDGFDTFDDMERFWREVHRTDRFEGLLIRWGAIEVPT